MPTYRYTGDVPVVFVSLIKDDQTWVPSTGDTIDLDFEVEHALLELVVSNKSKGGTEVAKQVESPETADDSEEN
jgi:hypothetical protein